MEAKESRLADGRRLVLREATGADAGAVLSFLEVVCGESDFLSFGPGEFTLAEAEEAVFLESCRGTSNWIYLLALVGGEAGEAADPGAGEEIAGTLHFTGGERLRTRHSGEFGISVRRTFWGQRVGSALLDALVDWARAGGVVCKLNLKVRSDNRRAIALYERKGFVLEGTIRADVLVDGIFYDHNCMGLWL